jgi:hypothetical protein
VGWRHCVAGSIVPAGMGRERCAARTGSASVASRHTLWRALAKHDPVRFQSTSGNMWLMDPLSPSLLVRMASGIAHMSRFASLSSKRVPVYISLPIIVACGAAGYIANTIRPGGTIISQAPIHRLAEPEPVAVSPVAVHATPDQKQLSRVSVPRRDVLLPLAGEVDLPTLNPNVVARGVPAKVIEPAPRVPVTKAMSNRPRATRAVRTRSKARRPQRVARQPTSTPAPASTGLKSIPLIGPVFSLLQ